MIRRLAAQRRWVAIFAAYLFALQAMVSGLALAASAAPALDPLAGGFICSASGTRSAPDEGPGKSGPHLPSCCVAGCTMLGLAVVTPAPSDAWLPVRQPLAGQVFLPPVLADVPAGFDRAPPNMRAPPPVV